MSLDVVRVESVGRAAAMLAEDPGAHFLAGGTLLVRRANEGDPSITRLILCEGLGLGAIEIAGPKIVIGAAATMAAVAAHPALGFLTPAAAEIGGPAVRATATVGGNLFAPSPYGDFAAALLAFDAEVTIESPEGSDTIGLEAFLANRDAPGRIVRGVAFAAPPEGSFRFAKVVRRKPHGASVLAIAARLPVADGRLAGVRIAYGAMAPTAIRAYAAEAALESRVLDDAAIASACAVAAEGCSPQTDPFASDWYRLNVLPVHLGRLLRGETAGGRA